MLAAVKENVDQLKTDLGDLLKDTWALKIDEIKKSMSKVENDRKKAPQPTDSKVAQQVEREYKTKMDELNRQLDSQ